MSSVSEKSQATVAISLSHGHEDQIGATAVKTKSKPLYVYYSNGKHFKQFNLGFNYLQVIVITNSNISTFIPLEFSARSLRFLDLSDNRIDALPPADFWLQFEVLLFIFLSNNLLSGWIALEGLQPRCNCTELPAVRWLVLEGNPIMSLRDMRPFIGSKLPSLYALDNMVITDIELVQTQAELYPHHQRASVPYKICTKYSPQSSTLAVAAMRQQLCQTFQIASSTLTVLDRVRFELQRSYLMHSPSILIQSRVRGYLSRRVNHNSFRISRAAIVHLQRYTRGYILRRRIQQALEDLVFASHGNYDLLRPIWNPSLPKVYSIRSSFFPLLQALRTWRKRLLCSQRSTASAKISRWINRKLNKIKEIREKCARYLYCSNSMKARVHDFARKAALCDPFFASLPIVEVDKILTARFILSDVRIIRYPALKSYEQTTEEGDAEGKHSENLSTGLLRKLRSDKGLEIDGAKQLLCILENDKSTSVLKSTSSSDQERLGRYIRLQQSEMNVHTGVAREILLKKQKNHQVRPCISCAIRNVRYNEKILKPRGNLLLEHEKKKLHGLAKDDTYMTAYELLLIFIPWNIAMYESMVNDYNNGPLSNAKQGLILLDKYSIVKQCAAVLMQSAWRRAYIMSHCSIRKIFRHRRAVLCVQRYWRARIGIKRRFNFIDLCYILHHSVRSRHLYIERKILKSFLDPTICTRIQAVQRKCHEQCIECGMTEGQHPTSWIIQSTAIPVKLLTRSEIPSNAKRLSIPEIISHILRNAEPTDLTEELDSMARSPASSPSYTKCYGQASTKSFLKCSSQFCGATYAKMLSVVNAEKSQNNAIDLKDLLHVRFKGYKFMRITYDTTDEARRCALIMLALTYDPITMAYARLYSLESLLLSASLYKYPYLLWQDENIGHGTKEHFSRMLRADLPSKWWSHISHRLGEYKQRTPGLQRVLHLKARLRHQLMRKILPKQDVMVDPIRPPVGSQTPSTPSIIGSLHEESAPVFIKRDQKLMSSKPACDPPTNLAPGKSRHAYLCERYSACTGIHQKDRQVVLEKNCKRTNTQREQLERATQALAVDQRILQCEKLAESAAATLEVQVHLHRLQLEKQQTRLTARDRIKQNSIIAARTTLTRNFEKTFGAQIGALTRLDSKNKDKQRHGKEQCLREAAKTCITQQKELGRQHCEQAKIRQWMHKKQARKNLQAEFVEKKAFAALREAQQQQNQIDKVFIVKQKRQLLPLL